MPKRETPMSKEPPAERTQLLVSKKDGSAQLVALQGLGLEWELYKGIQKIKDKLI